MSILSNKNNSAQKNYESLVSYTPLKGKIFHDVCDYCGKEFEFKSSDIKDRVVKCPYCGHDIQFFAYLYK